MKDRQYTTRTIAYYSLVATGAIDTRKMSMQKFMPIDDDNDQVKPRMTEYQKEAFITARNLAIAEIEKQQKNLVGG
jgi:hypothetical protein